MVRLTVVSITVIHLALNSRHSGYAVSGMVHPVRVEHTAVSVPCLCSIVWVDYRYGMVVGLGFTGYGTGLPRMTYRARSLFGSGKLP